MAEITVKVCDATGMQHPFMQVVPFNVGENQVLEMDLIPDKVTELAVALLSRLPYDMQKQLAEQMTRKKSDG